MLEALTLQSRGREMVCLIDYPDEASKGKKMILYKHGFMGNKTTPHRMIVNFAHRLEAEGITTFRFDCAGAGDSEGDCHLTTIAGEMEDTRVVLDYIKKVLQPEQFIVLGYSMGACVVGAMANEIEMDGLLLWSPVSVPYENFKHLLGEKRFAQGLAGEDVDFGGDRVGKEFFAGLKDENIDPIKAIRHFQKPVRLVQGTGDTDVLPESSQVYADAAPDAKRHTIPGANHGYDTVAHQEELFAISAEYIREIWSR